MDPVTAPARPITSPDVVLALPGVAVVVDVDGHWLAGQAGIDRHDDRLEMVVHCHEAWTNLAEAVLPVLGEAFGQQWSPPGFYAAGAGEHVIIGARGRCVIAARNEAGKLLTAVVGDGTVDGVAVW